MKECGSSANHHPPVVGILGGICSGKTTVARLLAERGFELINADRIGHEMLGHPEIQSELQQVFGEGIFDENGQIDRQILARTVFDEQDRIEQLNAIVHPPILDEVEERIEHATQPVVLDAALLVEKGLHEKCCDLLVYVDAPARLRRKRAEEERNWEPEEIRRREKRQIPPERKRRMADIVITNDGTKTELKQKVQRLYTHIQKRLARSREFSQENADRE